MRHFSYAMVSFTRISSLGKMIVKSDKIGAHNIVINAGTLAARRRDAIPITMRPSGNWSVADQLAG